VNGNVALTLRLYNVSAGGAILYADSNTVAVSDGLYATLIGDNTISGTLDGAFTNSQVWLEAVVNGTVLTPREQMVAVPFARMVNGLQVQRTNNIALNPVVGSNVVEGSSVFSAIGGGRMNIIRSGVEGAVIAGGVSNIIGTSSDNATIGGGHRNLVSLDSTNSVVSGGRYNFIFSPNTVIGGGGSNLVRAGANFSAILGGGFNTINASSVFATVSGGASNTIDENAIHATIGGGRQNTIEHDTGSSTISGGRSNLIEQGGYYAAIGGGRDNVIGPTSRNATVSGGWMNKIQTNATYGAIAGGFNNRIESDASFSTILGGFSNSVGRFATNAMAAGRKAQALHRGTFVWADYDGGPFASTDTDQFLVRAAGGVGINTNAPQATLDVNGSVRVGGGSVFDRIVEGTTVLGPGTNTMSYAVTFPKAFASSPKVIATPRNDPSFNVPDTFCVTIRSISTTGFVLNVHRVDSAGGWAQQLRLDWIAWD
jgi:hypothetical protein